MYDLLEEADRIIDEDKREEYGSVEESFSNIASMWQETKEMTKEMFELAEDWMPKTFSEFERTELSP